MKKFIEAFEKYRQLIFAIIGFPLFIVLMVNRYNSNGIDLLTIFWLFLSVVYTFEVIYQLNKFRKKQ